MTHAWMKQPDGSYRCERCLVTVANASSLPDEAMLRRVPACVGRASSLARMERHGNRRQIAGSIRQQYDLDAATVPLRTAAGRLRQCYRCEHLAGDCCDLMRGTCAERYPKWIVAITTGPDDSWCPLLKEAADE